MRITTDIIIYFIKLFIMNFYVYYCFKKISNVKEFNAKQYFLLIGVNLIIVYICTFIEFCIDSFLSLAFLIFLYSIVLGKLSNKEWGYALITTIIANALCIMALGLSIILEFIPYKLLSIDNSYLNLFVILLIQFAFLFKFFKIKRFKNGFDFLNKKLNNDFVDIIIINISLSIIFTYCLLGTILERIEKIRKNMLISFLILGFIMIIIIKKTFTMYYKQKLQKEALKKYESELYERDKEIEKLKNEKFYISKTTHEFYHRQKVLEMIVTNTNFEVGKEMIVLDKIESLTQEYSDKIKTITKTPELQLTNISEIDDMIKYLHSECRKNDIEMKLKIIGNTNYLVSNLIEKSKLELLLADHIKDALIAITSSNNKNREILAIIGNKNKIYEVCIYDTGKEFEIETLLKLGLEPITTHKEIGGSGIGFITTFETLKECKGSLIIEEKQKMMDTGYTKAIIIRFDSKNEYRIKSYRADELKAQISDNRIIIEDL